MFRPEMILTEEENKEGEISKETLFSYHYFYGVVLRRSRKLKEARVSFKKAIEVATTDSKRARALYNVGITYYDEQKYNSAIDWSRRALDKVNGDIETQGAILNNMANYYYVKGEIGKAYYYLELAMGSLRAVTHVGRKLVIYDTYLDLHSDNGTKLLQVLLEILKSYTSLNEYSDHLGTCLEKLFVQLRKNGDIDNIKELFNSLLLYTKIIGEKRSVKI